MNEKKRKQLEAMQLDVGTILAKAQIVTGRLDDLLRLTAPPPEYPGRDTRVFWMAANTIGQLERLYPELREAAKGFDTLCVSTSYWHAVNGTFFPQLIAFEDDEGLDVTIRPGVKAAGAFKSNADGGYYPLNHVESWVRVRKALVAAAEQTGSDSCLVDWEGALKECYTGRDVGITDIGNAIRASGLADCGVQMVCNNISIIPDRPDISHLFRLFVEELSGTAFLDGSVMSPGNAVDLKRQSARRRMLAGCKPGHVITRLLFGAPPHYAPSLAGNLAKAYGDHPLSFWRVLPSTEVMPDANERAAAGLAIVTEMVEALRGRV